MLSSPVHPSSESSSVPPFRVSVPEPPLKVSLPGPPFTAASFPSPPSTVSSPASPFSATSLPLPPLTVSLSAPPFTASASPAPSMPSSPASPLIVSAPPPPVRVSSPMPPFSVRAPGKAELPVPRKPAPLTVSSPSPALTVMVSAVSAPVRSASASPVRFTLLSEPNRTLSAEAVPVIVSVSAPPPSASAMSTSSPVASTNPPLPRSRIRSSSVAPPLTAMLSVLVTVAVVQAPGRGAPFPVIAPPAVLARVSGPPTLSIEITIALLAPCTHDTMLADAGTAASASHPPSVTAITRPPSARALRRPLSRECFTPTALSPLSGLPFAPRGFLFTETSACPQRVPRNDGSLLEGFQPHIPCLASRGSSSKLHRSRRGLYGLARDQSIRWESPVDGGNPVPVVRRGDNDQTRRVLRHLGRRGPASGGRGLLERDCRLVQTGSVGPKVDREDKRSLLKHRLLIRVHRRDQAVRPRVGESVSPGLELADRGKLPDRLILVVPVVRVQIQEEAARAGRLLGAAEDAHLDAPGSVDARGVGRSTFGSLLEGHALSHLAIHLVLGYERHGPAAACVGGCCDFEAHSRGRRERGRRRRALGGRGRFARRWRRAGRG